MIAVAAGDRLCGECPCQDADEHLAYCGAFRRPLAGTGPHMRLRECLEAEELATRTARVVKAARARLGYCECDWETTGHTGACIQLALALAAYDEANR